MYKVINRTSGQTVAEAKTHEEAHKAMTEYEATHKSAYCEIEYTHK